MEAQRNPLRKSIVPWFLNGTAMLVIYGGAAVAIFIAFLPGPMHMASLPGIADALLGVALGVTGGALGGRGVIRDAEYGHLGELIVLGSSTYMVGTSKWIAMLGASLAIVCSIAITCGLGGILHIGWPWLGTCREIPGSAVLTASGWGLSLGLTINSWYRKLPE